ncbi:MAG: hypothetical protein JSV10_10355 [Candidatus Zixiibacteriota bacterium]|nr:MAG: hypothetical protein JSV10_10355 [candidate division Zixibacteria bacterium]
MDKINARKAIVFLLHAFAIWAICGASVGIGRAATSERIALIIHAIFAPVISAIVASIYFRKFNYTTPLQTAVLFVCFVIFMDFFVVSLLILGDFGMFASALGTWIPFALMFTSIYLTGRFLRKPMAITN